MTFKEFAEAMLAGKEVIDRGDDNKIYRLSSRGALEREDEDGDVEFLDNGDFELYDLADFRVKEKSIVVYESELNKLVDKLSKVKATQSGDVKDNIAKTLQSMLKMN